MTTSVPPAVAARSDRLTDSAVPIRDVVVVGVDGSAASRCALQWGRFLAESGGCTIEVVTAWPPYSAYAAYGSGQAGWAATMPVGWDPAGNAERTCREAIETAFGDDLPEGLAVVPREGSPTAVLVEASRGARMLVVGSRGHGGVAGLLLGSVSAACAEHALCPVFIVRGDMALPR